MAYEKLVSLHNKYFNIRGKAFQKLSQRIVVCSLKIKSKNSLSMFFFFNLNRTFFLDNPHTKPSKTPSVSVSLVDTSYLASILMNLGLHNLL